MCSIKKNVLQFICPTGFYGAERWILALAQHLNTDKIISHLAVTDEGCNQSFEIVDHYGKLGLPIHKIKMKGRFDPLVIKRLVNLIKKNDIKIIHTHGYKSDILGLIAARLAGIKAIATPHGFENAHDRKLQFYIKTGNRILGKFDVVAPLSEQLRSDIRALHVPEDRIALIRNGVDLDELTPWLRLDKNRNEKQHKIIGYVGQLSSRKNVADLIAAFDLLYQERQDIQLWLVGDGPQRKALQAKAASLACAWQVAFHGFREDRFRLMQQFDVMCMTSTLEGIPRALMEGMAMGIPVVAYEIPGVSDLVRHEDTGYLVPFGEVARFSGYLRKILFEPGFVNGVSGRAQESVRNEFSASRMATEYEQLYQSLI